MQELFYVYFTEGIHQNKIDWKVELMIQGKIFDYASRKNPAGNMHTIHFTNCTKYKRLFCFQV